jgi:cellulose synthase/poly-beta-1,6-N-acetylglucosamine synthase-like glycosyltransferase
MADELGMDVIVGAWIENDAEENDKEVTRLAKLLQEKHRSIKLVVVGNEVLTFKRQSARTVIDYIKYIKQYTTVPVGYADLLQTWRSKEADDIAFNSDFVGLHLFPYYLNARYDQARDLHLSMFESVQKKMRKEFGKETLLLETGWPSAGTQRYYAMPGLQEQRDWLHFLNFWQQQTGNFYNVIGTYDQPWKLFDEGRTGVHWGLFSMTGESKDVVLIQMLNVSYGIGLIWFLLFLVLGVKRLPFYRVQTQLLYQYFALYASVGLGYSVYTYLVDYLFRFSIIYTTSFVVIQIIIAVLCTNIFIYAFTYIGKSKEFLPPLYPLKPANIDQNKNKLVSIHIPCYNEAPEHVIKSIQSCLNQTHLALEVVVIENNTMDEKIWKPIEVWCANKPRVKFFHIDKLKGYKAGALNVALAKTDMRASYVALIDADYVASPRWIETALAYMDSDAVGAVQFPQAYKKESGNNIEKLATLEQMMAFDIGLMPRAHDNATIMHGTMCVIDRKMLDQLRGWATWSAADDSELGLRLALKGKEIRYVHEIIGEGVAPQTVHEFFKQRRRWAYGAIGIFLRYWKELLFGMNARKMSFRARTHYIFGWLSWLCTVLFLVSFGYLLISAFFVHKDIRYTPFIGFLLMSCLMSVLHMIVGIVVARTWLERNPGADQPSLLLFTILHVAMVHHLAMASLKAITPFVHKPFTRTSKSTAQASNSWKVFDVYIPKQMIGHSLVSAVIIYFFVSLNRLYIVDFDMFVVLSSLAVLGSVYLCNAYLFMREFWLAEEGR